jgi:uncharacterized protein with GYD domain
MATFLMSGKYSPMSLQDASPERTKKAIKVAKQFKGRIEKMYATLGSHDLLVIADFPGTEEAMRASIALTKLTGIGFTTMPAVSVDVFDKLLVEGS